MSNNNSLRYLLLLILMVLCAEISFKLPDVDQQLRDEIPSKILLHRSILTHNFVFALLVYWAAIWRKSFTVRLLTYTAGLATAVHLSFDLFPRAWQGFAIIHIPVLGRSSPLFSQIWIALSIVVCLYLVLSLIQTSREVAIVAVCFVLLFVFYTLSENEKPESPAATLTGATAVTLVLPADVRATAQRVYHYARNRARKIA
jgi:predicted neutral ceramidase superfamily lipid hydrolase